MIIKKIAFGDASEAYIENKLKPGFNIIYSNDNNKGKTIVMQSALYAIGNDPIFPSSFPFDNYYHYVALELDNGTELEACRKGNSFVVKSNDSISILDSVAELKRFLNRNGISFPVIIKDNIQKIVDPVLLYQLFFVGQDRKDTASIFNSGYYKKDDFWNLMYAMVGIECDIVDVDDKDAIKKKIDLLTEEKKALKSKHKILKSKKATTLDLVSQQRYNESIENKIKKITTLQNKIVILTKSRNRAASRRLVNERTLNEIRSLNRSEATGSLYCVDCGSNHIAYRSGDKSYTFDITDVEMRRNIMESIQDKISAYEEEEENCKKQINELQRQLQALLKEEELSLETVLMYKNEIIDASSADSRLVEIDNEIKTLKASLVVNSKKSEEDAAKRDALNKQLIEQMNFFYKKVDPNGSIVFDDLFSKRNNTYSGCEETEFYLAKLYAIAIVLKHKYPIMMDFFRDGELSTEKEKTVLQLFSALKNQIIFTATLKSEELGKYKRKKKINGIDYSVNNDSHILSERYVRQFKKLLAPMIVKI